MNPKAIRRRSGQTMIEYIIIVVLIAIGGLVLFGLLGDTLNKKTSGAISAMDDEKGADAQAAANVSSTTRFKSLDESGNSN